jgi:hypothetical protein
LSYKEAYALSAVGSYAYISGAFGAQGRNAMVSNFQKFMMKGESITRVRGQYFKTIERDVRDEVLSIKRMVKDDIFEKGKKNGEN